MINLEINKIYLTKNNCILQPLSRTDGNDKIFICGVYNNTGGFVYSSIYNEDGTHFNGFTEKDVKEKLECFTVHDAIMNLYTINFELLPSKFYHTRKGKIAKILENSLPGNFPIGGVIFDKNCMDGWKFCKWTEKGLANIQAFTPEDIIGIENDKIN